jgi:uncharacterized membrane protein
MLVLGFLIGVVAGLRAMMAPAAVSWAAHLGWLPLAGSPLAFIGEGYTPWILTALAIGELITDQLPSTPSRTVPVQFAARLVSGALSGACFGPGAGPPLAGMVGAVVGTLGGRELRRRLARAFGQDRPAALLEDAIAVVGAGAIVALVG